MGDPHFAVKINSPMLLLIWYKFKLSNYKIFVYIVAINL